MYDTIERSLKKIRFVLGKELKDVKKSSQIVLNKTLD